MVPVNTDAAAGGSATCNGCGSGGGGSGVAGGSGDGGDTGGGGGSSGDDGDEIAVAGVLDPDMGSTAVAVQKFDRSAFETTAVRVQFAHIVRIDNRVHELDYTHRVSTRDVIRLYGYDESIGRIIVTNHPENVPAHGNAPGLI